MPCDSITTQTISAALSKALPNLLADALQAHGWTLTGQQVNAATVVALTARRGGARLTWTAGKGLSLVTGSTAQAEALQGEITRAYSRQAVSWAAQRAGWTVKRTGDNTLTVNRR